MGTLTIDLLGEGNSYHTTFQDVPAKKSYLQSYLLTDAITNLIGHANTMGWEHQNGELQPNEFYSVVLDAIARHYSRDVGQLPSTFDTLEVLTLLIDNLAERGYLSKKLKEEYGESFYDET